MVNEGNRSIWFGTMFPYMVMEENEGILFSTKISLYGNGYSSVSIPREGRIGGGIAIVHKSDITLRSKSIYNYQTMECADILLNFQNMLVNLCVIYRPPNTSIVAFCEDLTDHQERNATSPGRMIIVGDIKIPTNKEQYPDTVY